MTGIISSDIPCYCFEFAIRRLERQFYRLACKKSPTVQEEDCGATGFYGFYFLEGNMKNHALF